jgi:hypothetical protein
MSLNWIAQLKVISTLLISLIFSSGIASTKPCNVATSDNFNPKGQFSDTTTNLDNLGLVVGQMYSIFVYTDFPSNTLRPAGKKLADSPIPALGSGIHRVRFEGSVPGHRWTTAMYFSKSGAENRPIFHTHLSTLLGAVPLHSNDNTAKLQTLSDGFFHTTELPLWNSQFLSERPPSGTYRIILNQSKVKKFKPDEFLLYAFASLGNLSGSVKTETSNYRYNIFDGLKSLLAAAFGFRMDNARGANLDPMTHAIDNIEIFEPEIRRFFEYHEFEGVDDLPPNIFQSESRLPMIVNFSGAPLKFKTGRK